MRMQWSRVAGRSINILTLVLLIISMLVPATPVLAVGEPAAPTSLAATIGSATQVDLAWTDTSDNETSFRIERSLDNFATASSANLTASANQTSLGDTTVIQPNTYYYRVIAVNGAGDSTPSNVAAIKVDVPNAPSDLTAIVMSATRVDLIWTDQSNNEASFRIERSLDGFATAPSANFTAALNQRTFTNSTVTANNTYSYRVVAINPIGVSVPSNTATAQVTGRLVAGPIDPATIYPGAPAGVASGVPGYYQDSQGTRVALLPTTGNGLTPPTQIFDNPVPANPYSVFLGFGTEAFYYDATNVFDLATGGRVTTVFGLEHAFGGSGNATPGQELIFNRTRIRINVPMAGTYTVQHPYGTLTFNVTQDEFIANAGIHAINYTNDVGVQRDFAAATEGVMTRFLHQTTPPPPAGWIGDGASVGPVTGSPTGFNAVKVTGPVGSNIGGPGIDFIQSNNFMVSGRMPTAVTPLPNFTTALSPANGVAPVTANFTDTSTGAPTKWLWDFGDGTTATSQNATKTYNASGNYLVRLTVTNAVATVATSQTITVYDAPVASFTNSLPNGIPPVSINFTDNSTGNPTSWLWIFGDNTTSTLQNPSHVYAAAGSYTVNMTAANAAGTSSISRTLGISANLTAAFSSNVTSGVVPLSVGFTNTSTGNITGWLWSFGDNTTSTSQNATKTYTTPGNYTVTLAITDAAGSAGTSQVVSAYGALTANFTSNPPSGAVPLTVNFSDTSTGNPASRIWTFHDGTTSTLANPSKTYSAFGRYPVTLAVTNPAGTVSTTQTVSVTTVDPTTLLLQVGPIDPNSIYQGNLNSGLPSYYQDDQGTRLSLRPISGDGLNPPTQVFDPAVLTNPYSVFLGYGSEAFYWVATADAGPANVLFGLEAAFGGDGSAQPGNEFVFARTRVRADVPVAGTYTLQHPYGTLTFNVTAEDIAGGKPINYTSDIGVPRDFLAAAAPNNGGFSRFLRQTVPTPPPGWIGDGFNRGPVTGSPTGFNRVRFTGPAGSNLGGPGIDFVETADRFNVSGRLFGALNPTFNISLNPANGVAPVSANFTDTTTGNITAWSWNFGDGTTATSQNATKAYNTPGIYVVSLSVTDNASVTGTTSRAVSVFSAAPVANFTKSVATGAAPLKVTFTDTSTGVPASWLWDFGDGTTSTLQNPTKTYTAAGIFTVTLTVTNPAASASTSQTVTVIVPPVASFTKSAASGIAPLTINFTDTSTNAPTAWSWNFGDGTTSTLQNPSHTFAAAGTFSTTMTVTNAAGTAFATQTITVTAPEAPADGGGGVAVPPPPGIPLTGLTSISGVVVDTAGVAQVNAKVETNDGKVSLTIPQGTKLQTANGQPLATISAAPLTTTPPKAPPNTTIILPVDFGPDGAKFNPPLTVTMKFDPATLPAGTRVDKLKIAYWDGNGWVKLGKSTVDATAGTITGEISHFTIFAVLAEEELAPVPTPVPTLTPAPESAPTTTPATAPAPESTPTPTPTPEPAPVSQPTPTAPVPQPEAPAAANPAPIIGGIILAAAAVFFLVLIFLKRRSHQTVK